MITNEEIKMMRNSYAGLSNGFQILSDLMSGKTKSPDPDSEDDKCLRMAIKFSDRFPAQLNHLGEYIG